MKHITINNWSDLNRALKNDYKAICAEMIDELMQGIITWPMLKPEYQNLDTMNRIIDTDYNSKPKENSLFNLLEKKIFDWCREKYKISNRPNSIKCNTKSAYEFIAKKLKNSRKYKAFLTARGKFCYDEFSYYSALLSQAEVMKQKIEDIKAFVNDWPNHFCFDDDYELLDNIAKNGRAIIGTHPNPCRIKPLCLVDKVYDYSDHYRNDYEECKDFYEGWCTITSQLQDDDIEETFFNIWLTKELIFAVHGDNAENVWDKYVSTLATDDEFCETIKTYYK